MKRIAVVGLLILSVLVGGGDAFAQNTKKKPTDAKTLEKQLAAKRKELKAVAADRRQLDSKRGSAAKDLRTVEEKVGASARALAMTQQRITVEQTNLRRLNSQKQVLSGDLGAQVSERERLLRAAYRQNRQGPLKALLSQDSVAKSQRTLTYHRYLQKNRQQRIQGLNQQLSSLDAVQREINGRQRELTRSQMAQRSQVQQLEKDRADRAKLLQGLNAKYASTASREKALGKDVAGLNRLLGQLRAAAARAERERVAIAKKRAAEAAREQRRLEQAEQQRIAKANSSNSKAAGTKSVASTTKAVSTPTRTESNEPVRAPQRIDTPKPTVASTGPAVGGVGWPATGALLAGFGGTMPDGRRSQGLLIGASRGAPVRAVTAGEVVYAQWMTGYGQLLIIDHGGGRMSLYAYNEALLKNVGDRVGRGDTIATVGASGGQGRPALYFELRSNGSPINPRSMMQ